VKPSIEAKDLVVRLLDKNQKSRLKISAIKSHKFFEGINFQNLYDMTITPPLNIDLVGEEDYKYIDPHLDKEMPEDSQVNELTVQMAKGKIIINWLDFKDFTYAGDKSLGK